MKQCVRSTMLVVLCLALPAAALAADWPHYRGPLGIGFSPETGIRKDWAQKPPTELWRVAMSDGGYAGPSVANGKVFIIDHQGAEDIVRAFDLATGQEVWRFAYPDAAEPNHGFARSTPTISEGKVYTLSRLGWVHCLDEQTGAKIWARNIQADFGGHKPEWDYSMSVTADTDGVVVCPGGPDAAVAKLDKNTGETIWKGGGSDIPGYATPVVAEIQGVKQYVVFAGVSLIGVAAETGELLWRHPWQTQYDINAATPLVEGNLVFISSGYGHGCAMLEITAQGPQVRWENKELQAHFNSPVALGGYIYGIGDPGVLVCLDPKTGNAVWKQEGFEKGGVCALDGVLIAVAGNTGDVVMVRAAPAGYEELGRFNPLGGQSWTAPIVADGKLILRNLKALACFDLR